MRIFKLLVIVIFSFLLASVSQATLQAQTTKCPVIQVGSRQGPSAWARKSVILAAHPTTPLFAAGGADGEIDVFLPQDGANGAFSIRPVCKMLNKSGAVTHIALSGQTLVAVDEFGEVRVWHLANLLDANGGLLASAKSLTARTEIISEPSQVLSDKVQRTTWLGLSADGFTCQVLADGKFQEFALAGARASVVKLASFQESASELREARFLSVRGSESFFLRRNVLVCENSKAEKREILFPMSSKGDVRNVDLRQGRRLIATSDKVHFWAYPHDSWREEFRVENVVRARLCANGLLVLRDGLQLTYRASSGSVLNFDARDALDRQIEKIRNAAIKAGSKNLSSMESIQPDFSASDMLLTADGRFFAISGEKSAHVIFGVLD